jgi:hypothetical protein
MRVLYTRTGRNTDFQANPRVHCKKVNFTAEAQRTQRKRGVIQEKISARLRAPRVSAVGLEAFFSRAIHGSQSHPYSSVSFHSGQNNR